MSNKLFHVNGKDEKAPIEAGDIVSDGAQVWRVVNGVGKLQLHFVMNVLEELKAMPANACLILGSNVPAMLPSYPLPFVDSLEPELREWESKTLQAG